MSKEHKVIIALESVQQTHSWEFGQKALQILYDGDPRLWPDRVGRDDGEMRKKLPCAKVADLEPLWAAEIGEWPGIPKESIDDLFFKRYRPLNVFGSFGYTWINQKETLLASSVKLHCKFTMDIDFLSIFKALCLLYKPTQGYLHYIGPHDRWNGGEIVLTEEDIQRIGADLPNINPRVTEMRNWGYFGSGIFGPYWETNTYNLGQVNFFPNAAITDAMAVSLKDEGIEVTSFDEGCLVSLCPSLEDVKNDFPMFSRKRAIAKKIIGQQNFVIKDEPAF